MAMNTPRLLVLFASLTACTPDQNNTQDPAIKGINAHCPSEAKAQVVCLSTLESRAEQISERIDVLSRRYADLAYKQGRDFMDKGAADKAQQAFQNAATLQPNFIDARIGLGAACYELKDLACALQELETAQELSKTQKIDDGTRRDLNTLRDTLRRHQI